MQIRYALLVGSLRNRFSNVPASLLSALLRAGVWRARPTLDHALNIADEAGRVNSLIAIIPHLQGDRKAEAIRVAIATAWTLSTVDTDSRVALDLPPRYAAMTRLVTQMNDVERAEVLPRILDQIVDVDDTIVQAQEFKRIAPYLGTEERTDAIRRILPSEVAYIGDRSLATQAMRAVLVDYLPLEDRDGVLANARRSLARLWPRQAA